MPATDNTVVAGAPLVEITAPVMTIGLPLPIRLLSNRGNGKDRTLMVHGYAAIAAIFGIVVITRERLAQGNAVLGRRNRNFRTSRREDDAVELRVASEHLRIVRPGIGTVQYLVNGIVANARYRLTIRPDDTPA